MQNPHLKFAFFGTPDVASRTLDILEQNGYSPTVIITSVDRRSGRGMHMTESPVSMWAKTHGIPCLKPEKITKDFIEELKGYDVDLSIVVAYGVLLPQDLIDLPRYGTINIHYSLLPLYRGASPVEEALLNGDTETGVSIQEMRLKLDSGPIVADEKVKIEIDDRKESLREKLISLGGNLLSRILPSVIEGKTVLQPQDESKATYCTKIKKEDGEIDPDGNAWQNYNKYRAYEGWPGVYFFLMRHNKKIRIKVTGARYSDDSFIIEKVIPEGRHEMAYTDLLRGRSL
ncbi:MAG: methionyl-tRNA formyltransferase [Patescibacteria group bacterium]